METMFKSERMVTSLTRREQKELEKKKAMASMTSLERLEQQQANLQQKQDEIKAKIRAIKSKEKAEQRKHQTHLKFLLGAYALHSYAEIGGIAQDKIEKLRAFIKDDKKTDEIVEMINAETKKYKS